MTIREEVVLTLFHAQIEVQGEDGGAPAVPEPLDPQGPNGNLQYAHETVAGADAIAASAGGAATALAAPAQAAPDPGGQRAQGRRPQRSVLVRERQEVQDGCHGALAG